MSNNVPDYLMKFTISNIRRSILEKPWNWAAIGVFVSVAGILVTILLNYQAFQSGRPMTAEERISGEIEGSLAGLEDQLDFIIRPGQERMIEEDIQANEVSIGDEAILIVPAHLNAFSIRAMSIDIGSGVEIRAYGQNGQYGIAGDNGRAADSDCSNGTAGNAGQPGMPGESGIDVTITSRTLTLDGPLTVNTSGGDGGDGGLGGKGGNGGRADRSDGCSGGDGGRGGDGGPAGDAGDGGDLWIEFVSLTDRDGTSIPPSALDRLVVHANNTALPGTGGPPGDGGSGGSRRGGWGPFGTGAQPGGSRGSRGNFGPDGNPGQPGSFVVAHPTSNAPAP